MSEVVSRKYKKRTSGFTLSQTVMLEDMWDGNSVRAISASVGKSRTAINNKAAELGLPSKTRKKRVKPKPFSFSGIDKKRVRRIPAGSALLLMVGGRYLHMFGQSLTDERVWAWRGTLTQSKNMLAATCIHELVLVQESGL